MASGQPTPEQEAVLAYLKQHEISEKLSRAVNAVCQVKSNAPAAFLAKKLMEEQKEFTITGVKARQIFDSRGDYICTAFV